MQERPGPNEALEAFEALAGILESEPQVQVDTLSADPLDETRFREGLPLFSREALPLHLYRAGATLLRILDHLAEAGRPDRPGLERAAGRLRDDPAWRDALFRAVAAGDGDALARPARETGLDPAALRFLVKTALRPHMEGLRRAAAERLPGGAWSHGYCPLCGSGPDMACLDEAGKRLLHCDLCGTEWFYRRIGCPFCGNEDQERLGYLTADGEEGVRVDLCEACRRYLKTVDRRILEAPAPLDLEHLATLHLDLAAAGRGYRPP